MGEQIAASGELVQLNRPIDLQHVNKQSFLFYLAGRVPVSIDELAADCRQGKDDAEKILNERFQRETNTNQTGFIRLSDPARGPVMAHGKRFIKQAKRIGNEADALREDDELGSAGTKYEHAATLLATVRDRFESMNYVPEQLKDSISHFEDKCDETRKRYAKETYKHRRLFANQYEDEADEAFQAEDFETAEESFEKAKEALQDALDEIESYNDCRLADDSPQLRVDTLEDQVNDLEKKYARTKERVTEESSGEAQTSVSTAESNIQSVSESDAPSADEVTEGDLIDAIDDLADTLGRAPTTTEMKEQGRFEPHHYYDTFGTWADALKQAERDVESDFIADLRRVADKLDQYPTQTNLDEHGRYDGHWYKQYFETWEDALRAAGIEEPTDEDLIDEIQRLDREHARMPSSNLMRDEGRYSPRRIRDRFGSWDDGLEAAGIDKRQRLIDELRRVNAECDGRPTTTNANEISIYSPTYFANEFGSWGAALGVAGIVADQQSPDHSETTREDAPDDDNGPSDEELITELQRLDRNLAEAPSGLAMREKGKYNPEMYHHRFGEWDEALAAAGITSQSASDSKGTPAEPAADEETDTDGIQPNRLAELYESLRVLNKVLIEYIETAPDVDLGDDDPLANWQSVIEDVAVGDGINADVPCLGKLHADRNPFSMGQYREQYGNGERVTDFQTLDMADVGAEERRQLHEAAESSRPKVQRPIVPGSWTPLPIFPSNETEFTQALDLLEDLLTTVLDIDTVVPPAISDSHSQPTPSTSSSSDKTNDTTSDPDPEPLTLADIDTNETYDDLIAGRLVGIITNPRGDALMQLHLEDITGDDFWLYIIGEEIDFELETGIWYFISHFRGPEELGGGRGDQALRSTPQLSIEEHGTTLPPSIDADVSSSTDSPTQSSPSTQTTAPTSSSDGQTASSSTSASSTTDRSDAASEEETDPMVDDLLEDMEENDLL